MVMNSNTGIPTLDTTVFERTKIDLPSAEEQIEIVRRVDQLFAHADRIEQQTNNALAHFKNLNQSILAKAFWGDLTKQWRKDNPDLMSGENNAAELLGKINADRAQVKSTKKTFLQTSSA